MKQNKMLTATVLSISLLTITASAVAAGLADISNSFPTTSPETIALILTLPSLTLIPITAIAGVLSNYVKKKTLVIIGLILFIIGGIGPVFTGDLTAVIILRGILGVGLGFISPLSSGLIVDFFEGKQRDTIFGLKSSAANIGCIITTLAAGFLALSGWQNMFWIYALGVPVLILVILKLPEPERPVVTERHKTKINGKVALYCVLSFVAIIFYFPFFTKTSMFVAAEQMGSAGDVGMVLTAATMAGFLVGLIFGKLVGFLKGFTSVLGCLLFAIGFFLISYSKNIAMVYAGSVLTGMAVTIVMTVLVISTSASVTADKATFAIGLVTAAGFFGQFISPYALGVIGRTMGNTSDRFSFLVSGVAFVIGAIALLVLNLLKFRLDKQPRG